MNGAGTVALVLVAAAGWAGVGCSLIVTARLRRRLELVARASHELRGPAAALWLAVAALRREPGGARRALALEVQLERMRAGLDDLEAARAGRRAAARPAVVGLERVVRRAAAGWAPVARGSGRRLAFRWEGAPVAVRADRGRLAQALGNLVANAVEHGSGPVELRGGRTGESVRVEVRDGSAVAPRRGVGDRRDRRDALGPGGDGGPLAPLGQGRRGDRAVDRGRGLAIARRAVEDAGGSLVLERGEDGTTAAIELPVAEP